MSCQINLDSNMYEEPNGLSLDQLYSISRLYNLEVIFQPLSELYIFVDESGRCLGYERITAKILFINEMYESDWKIMDRDQKLKDLLG